MKDTKFTYEELQEGINVLNQEEKLENTKEYFRLKEEGNPESKYIDKIVKMSNRGDTLLKLSLKYYVMDKPLDEVKEVMYYSVKCSGDERAYGEHHPGIDGKDSDEYIDGMTYADYLRELSVGYLLDGYEKKDVVGMEKQVHRIKGRDILLDTLLNAMIGCEVSDEIMYTNFYPSLANIIHEEDKEKAEDMIIDFMKNEWWKNTKRYYYASKKPNPNTYTSFFAYETAAIAKIKGLDYSKFKDLKYFPIDMLYYGEGIQVDVKGNEIFKKSLEIDNKEYNFETNIEDGKDFEQGYMYRPDFSNMTVENICFAYSTMEGMVAKKSKFVNCDFTDANIFGIQFEECEIIDCKFDAVNGEKASFHLSTLRGNRFNKSIIFDAGMTLSIVEGNDFIKTDLINLDLTNTEFRNNNLMEAEFVIYRDGRSKEDLESSSVMKFLDKIRVTPYKRETPDQIIENNKFIKIKIYEEVKFTEYEKENNEFTDIEIISD